MRGVVQPRVEAAAGRSGVHLRVCAAAVAGILGVIIQLAEFIIGSRTFGATKWLVATGLLLTVFALAGLAYIATHRGPPLPPFNVEIRELQVDDTKEVLANVNPDSVTELLSRSEHVKVIGKGQVTGFGLPSIVGELSAYALVRPPTEQEIWYVHKSERASVRDSGSFELEFYLGARGVGMPRHHQRFGLVILIADFQPSATYRTLAAIPKGRPRSATYELRVLRP